MRIQKLFNEIKNGNRNAVGELHRQLRFHMAPDGVFTHIYQKFPWFRSQGDPIVSFRSCLM